jgi:3',5'-cyclic AMP phosphodiesterase CpdA
VAPDDRAFPRGAPGAAALDRLSLRAVALKAHRALETLASTRHSQGVRIAHLSDLHLLALDGAVPFRLLNKRLTGYLNLRFRRRSVHKPFAVQAALREIRRLDVDHVVITGDVTNLALESEFELVRRVVEEDLGMPADRISLVPGNHDTYTRGSHVRRRFASTFARYMRSDIPELTATDDAFPFVQLRGPAALIGLSTARPRLPFVASGELGSVQLGSLDRILDHPEVRRRTPVVLQHHPLFNPAGRAHTLLEGLSDAREEMRVLRRLARGLLLHGHLHRRIHRKFATPTGHVDVVGATSASLLHESDEKMAGFNVYELADDGAIGAISSQRYHPESGDFRGVPLPVA